MMLSEKLKNHKVLLASGSPRRKNLLGGIDIDFEIVKQDVDETWPQALLGGDIAEYLAKKKSTAIDELKPNEILITADTIVWHENQIMNKPVDNAESFRMLSELSDSGHEVFTGVCIRTTKRTISFYDRTYVHFKKLSKEEIAYYIKKYDPSDKAGSYGAQDWLGYIAMKKIEGCYYNVMGLPIHRVYSTLMEIVED